MPESLYPATLYVSGIHLTFVSSLQQFANESAEQVIISDGQTVPGDCQLICNYNNPEDFEEFKKLKNLDKFSGEAGDPDDEKPNNDDDDDAGSIHYGLSLIACG